MYKYGNDFTYSNGTYTINSDNVSLWDRRDTNYKTNLKTHHYTCWNTTGECSSISYIYYVNSSNSTSPYYIYYINISDGKDVEDALEEILNNENVNQTNSTMKTYLDNWYQNNMTASTSKLEDTIFCNDRSIKTLNGWDPDGGSVGSYLLFKEDNDSTNALSCRNVTDRFSMANTKAQLTYPVGLMRRNEMNLLGNNNLRKTGNMYWLASPLDFNSSSAFEYDVNTSGSVSSDYVYLALGVRPAVSLAPGTLYTRGDGSKNSPYVVE